MRLHRLDAQAFGPFAAPVTVDFDELSSAGLFLLSGATGAGKTSVLDAVCFALYGDVPGDRAAAKRLRCDQAPADLPPRVELEATLGGRRFRLVRSPAWERPKRRGAGTTTEPAKVTVSELVDGAWTPLSSRIDETADLVARVTGLTLTQFTQVALLPQGRFQAFLRARSDERHRLLQQLFRTGRFEAVERWLADHRRTLARDDARHHERVADLVSRGAETATAPLPEGVDLHDLAPAAADGVLREWLDGARATAHSAAVRARRAAAQATGDEVERRLALESARAEVERRQRLDAAREELAGLAAHADRHAAELTRLDAARRAAAVAPWLRQAEAARADADDAAARADASCAAVGGAAVHDDLAATARRADDRAAEVAALLPRAQRLDELRGRLRAADRHRTRVGAELTRVQHERAVAPEALEELRAELLGVQETAAAVEPLTAAAQDVRVRLDAHREADELRPALLDAREEWLQSRELTVRLKDELVDVQLARIDGMAAELAGQIAVGGCCPVCGSAEHPAKASPAPGAPDAETERRARSAVDDAAVVEHARDQHVRDLERSLAAATARAGSGSADALAAHLAELQVSLAEALQAAGRLPDLQARHDADVRALAELATRAEVLLGDLSRAEAEHTALAREARDLGGELDALLDTADGTVADLERLHDEQRDLAERCRSAQQAVTEAAEAAARLDAAVAAARTAAEEAGFDDTDGAVRAALDPAALHALADRTARHDRRVAALDELLRRLTPDAEGSDAGVLPDVAALAESHRVALDVLRAASAEAALQQGRADRLAGLLADLDAALAAWAPVREQLAVATGLAAFVEGRSTDNLLRMRLSAYVLAYRLSQVVAAANERLARMSDQRYSLEHTGRRGAGETRGGLSLLVRDDWSGETRDPATLSGGETFVISLALALGLADVIAHEAGGVALDTLFVDEGFGSLDADTLDDVMDTLDALRDGGRVVGVVSHVAEMRDRIPTQLVVSKSRRGSTLALRR